MMRTHELMDGFEREDLQSFCPAGLTVCQHGLELGVGCSLSFLSVKSRPP